MRTRVDMRYVLLLLMLSSCMVQQEAETQDVGVAMAKDVVTPVVTPKTEEPPPYKQDLLTVIVRNNVYTQWVDYGMPVDPEECLKKTAEVIVQYAPNKTAELLCGEVEGVSEGSQLYGCYMSEINRITLNQDSVTTVYQLSKTLVHEFLHVMEWCSGIPDPIHSNEDIWKDLNPRGVEALTLKAMRIGLI